MTFGKRIKRFRLSNDLSLADLAAKVGVSDATINRWENGVMDAKICYVIPLCKALGITPNELLGWKAGDPQ